MEEDREQRLFTELTKIREEMHALREDFEKRGIREEFDSRINALEVEERLLHLQDELIAGSKPEKRGWFGHK